jgi:hypothetical protein
MRVTSSRAVDEIMRFEFASIVGCFHFTDWTRRIEGRRSGGNFIPREGRRAQGNKQLKKSWPLFPPVAALTQ